MYFYHKSSIFILVENTVQFSCCRQNILDSHTQIPLDDEIYKFSPLQKDKSRNGLSLKPRSSHLGGRCVGRKGDLHIICASED